jgi:hypothetical protein
MSSITKPSQRASAFVASAPDAKTKPKAPRPGRVQITLTVPPDMLSKLDAMAQQSGQTRAGLLLLGAARLLRDGL